MAISAEHRTNFATIHGNGNVSIWVNFFECDEQTNKQTIEYKHDFGSIFSSGTQEVLFNIPDKYWIFTQSLNEADQIDIDTCFSYIPFDFVFVLKLHN